MRVEIEFYDELYNQAKRDAENEICDDQLVTIALKEFIRLHQIKRAEDTIDQPVCEKN